jgi:hypothetical protein
MLLCCTHVNTVSVQQSIQQLSGCCSNAEWLVPLQAQHVMRAAGHCRPELVLALPPELLKVGRGDGTAAAYAATVLSFPHEWILSHLRCKLNVISLLGCTCTEYYLYPSLAVGFVPGFCWLGQLGQTIMSSSWASWAG